MAKVVNQDLPLEDIEDELDPPIPFLEQYRRTLSEGIDHPKYPAWTEGVNSTKRGARMAQRDTNPYFDKPAAREWRDTFKYCEECWEKQANFEEDIDPCTKQGSKHWTEPEMPKRAQRSVYFKLWMENCLDFRAANPGVEWTWCDEENPPDDAPEPEIGVASKIMGCNEEMDIDVTNPYDGCGPYTWEVSGGGEIDVNEGASVVYSSPTENPGCGSNPTFTVTDRWGKQASISVAVNCCPSPQDEIESQRYYFLAGYVSGDTIRGAAGEVLFSWGDVECGGVNHRICSRGYDSYYSNGGLIETIFYIGALPLCQPVPCQPAACDTLAGFQGCLLAGGDGASCGGSCGKEKTLEEGDDHEHGTCEDTRTEGMINAGCCPINFCTGEPL